ncbi:MAG: hypothetical protein IIA83_03875 [Thaumarchaeota archaeon]|nr:hypothetical protein [Nitrososphaerota archaeon]
MNIWVLGEIKTNADKHIEWNYRWPNFADADVLIINLSSIDKSRMELLKHDKVAEASKTILDRFLNGGIVIVITAPMFSAKLKPSGWVTNYHLCPINIDTDDVSEGTEIKYNENHPFVSYLKYVKKFKFTIINYDTKKILAAPSAAFGNPLSYVMNYRITDKADRELGLGYRATGGGQIIVIPAVTEIPIRDGINKIIETYRKPEEEKLESLPDWIKNVKLFGLNELKEKINQLNSQKFQIETEISTKTNGKKILENFYGLLYAQNKQLENTVKDSLKLLGFDEIKRIRNENDEDWVIDLKSIKGIDHGIIEVKGRNEKTKHSDIVQCNKWVDDYHLMEPPKNTKGIFISNQFRLESYPASKEKRTKFEPNELQYAKSREICIIPTYVLFEAVNKALDRKQKSRKEIEKLLYETNGVLSKL